MESDPKEMLRIILPEDSDDGDIDAVTSEYLNKLGRLTLEQILLEPARLAEDVKVLTEQTQELALTNYRTFVETANCSNKILKDFDVSRGHLDNFIEKMPLLVQECENFSAASKNILKEKSWNDQLLSQSSQLLCMLELPVLMQQALTLRDYESALDLFTYTNTCARKYHDLPAFQNITSEVTRLWFETLHHLFSQLRYDLPLPQCLQVLGYLRRANAVYESALDCGMVSLTLASPDANADRLMKSQLTRSVGDGLQLHFLKARGTWFDAALTQAQTNDKPLQQMVELHRVHLFNILTQHKAIFLTDAANNKLKGDQLNGAAALACWLNQKMECLVRIIEQYVVQEDETTLESLISQCMYLCLSFGRVGADMRLVMAPLFSKITANDFTKSLRKTDAAFELEMKHFKLSNLKITKKNITESAEQNQNAPPESLLDCYPLAEYCNGVLTALNSLRLVVPLCLARHVVDEMTNSLCNVSKVFSVYYHREQQGFSPSERELFVFCCNLFCEDLLPFLQKCVLVLFPVSLLAEQLGISAADVHNEKLLTLNVDKICLQVTDVLNLIKL